MLELLKLISALRKFPRAKMPLEICLEFALFDQEITHQSDQFWGLDHQDSFFDSLKHNPSAIPAPGLVIRSLEYILLGYGRM